MSDKPSSPLPPATEPEAIRALIALKDDIHEAATDLVHDAASWRETSDVTGGYAAASLMRDALENEKRATKLEAWADRLDAALSLVRASSPPLPVSPLPDCCCGTHHPNHGRCRQCPTHGLVPPSASGPSGEKETGQ